MQSKMLKALIIAVLCQFGLLSVSCNDQHDSGVHLQCNSICILPEFPRNGHHKFLGATEDAHPGTLVPNSTVIQYYCNVGYLPYSHSTAVCNGGTWVTQFIKCQKKVTCSLPTNPAHGSYELSDLSSALWQITEVPNWTTAIYSCDATFKVVGNRTSLCYNGLWITEPPQCRKTTACVVPDPPSKGTYSIIGSQDAPVAGSTIKENQVLFYDCPAPNILQGAPVIFCHNGNWLPKVPSCLGNNPCSLPPVPANGRIINAVVDINHLIPGIQVRSLSLVQYACDELFELTGTDNTTCYDGSWSSKPPQCHRSTNCILPDVPKTGSYSIVSSVEVPVPGAVIAENKALRFICPTKIEGPTDQVIVCSSGKWLPSVVECVPSSDCGNVSGSTSGVYVIQPTSNREPFDVYCDLSLAGQKWTVIQQRFSGDIDFYRNYTEYRDGFGIKTGNHWLGLEHIHEITKEGHHELYVELEAHNGTKAYARYDTFIVGSSSTEFQLTISGYSGTAGESLIYHNGMKFSTFDKGQKMASSSNCAKYRHGAWWYKNCANSNLNGRYHNTAVKDVQTMHWGNNFGLSALKTARMLIRRK